MSTLANIPVNLAALSVSLAFMIILIAGMLLQGMHVATTKTLVILAVLEAFILLGQIGQWAFYAVITSGDGSSLIGFLDSVLFCTDFILMYFTLVVFFRFIQIHIKDTALRTDKNVNISDKYFNFLIIWCCFFSTLLLALAFSHKIFVYDDTGAIRVGSIMIYLFLYRSNLLIYLSCLYLIIKYRRILGTSYIIILLFYIATRFILFPLDIKYYTTFSYIALALEVFILYLGIDRRRLDLLMSQQLKIAEQRAAIEEKNTRIMVSQIQPHFLYNTLSVIDYMCGKDPEMARTAINRFSDYLRMNMESLGSNSPISFEKELEHTKTYLWIEMLRFPDILDVRYDIQVTNFEIPPLSLQPLAENAVKHGVRGREEGGTVIISTRITDGKVVLSVEDNGIGFDTTKPPKDDRAHVGIENVRSRLALICNGTLEINSIPGAGTSAIIRIDKA